MRQVYIMITVVLTLLAVEKSQAQECFLGEVKMFAGNFAPRGYAFAHGQLLAISSNQALFSILGTTYGGDGRTTFALPDLRGRVPVGPGTGPGLSAVTLGQELGKESVEISETHQHKMTAEQIKDGADNNATGGGVVDRLLYAKVDSGSTNSKELLTSATGSGASSTDDNRQPSLGINYIICITGTFPSRS